MMRKSDVLNDFTNLMDDELSLLIKLKYDKYIEYCKHGEMWTININFVQEIALSW